MKRTVCKEDMTSGGYGGQEVKSSGTGSQGDRKSGGKEVRRTGDYEDRTGR